MLAAILLSAYLVTLALATAKAKGSPVTLTERGSSGLVFLERNQKAGNHHSRARLRHRSKRRVWNGLRLAGVAWLDPKTHDIDRDSPMGCIHFSEATWRDANDPHWGGMQMDRGFQKTYGSDFIRAFHGLANVWPITIQLVAAYRAYRGYGGYPARHYGPWSTAPGCGL